LEIDEAIELLAGDTQLAPGLAQTDFSASERNFAHVDRQLSDLGADALCHSPAMTRYRIEIVRHLGLLRFRLTELGRMGRLIGSEVRKPSPDENWGCFPCATRTTDFAYSGLKSDRRHR
jgi:hypothetical protein